MAIPYLHKLKIQAISAPYKDANGNWVNPSIGSFSNATGLEKDCNDQPKDKGNSRIIVDGESVEFSSIVYGDLSVPNLKRGDLIQVYQGLNLRLEGAVKRFSRDKFHVRIWV